MLIHKNKTLRHINLINTNYLKVFSELELYFDSRVMTITYEGRDRTIWSRLFFNTWDSTKGRFVIHHDLLTGYR
jgi:hypothetical protein